MTSPDLERAARAVNAFLDAMTREQRRREPMAPVRVPKLVDLGMTDRMMLINCMSMALQAADRVQQTPPNPATQAPPPPQGAATQAR